MGQYHKLVNVDKKEYLDPHSIGLGTKQGEHLSDERWQIYGSLADAMYILTMTSPNRGGGDLPPSEISGRWAGDRVMVVGDYTEDEDLPAHFMAGQLYGLADETYLEIGDIVREGFTAIYGLEWDIEKLGSYTYYNRKVQDKATV